MLQFVSKMRAETMALQTCHKNLIFSPHTHAQMLTHTVYSHKHSIPLCSGWPEGMVIQALS